ncbi:GLPGLI family protein [Roseivirga sp.]|uniref:GLPGLI family protein n=1 Tax=Roseivirga sp. TaxID=1964215 RepID=UPI003B8BD968
MKKFKNQLLLVIAFMTSGMISANAQNFQGYATYQSASKARSISFKGDGITPEMQKQLESAVKKQGQKEYTLKFNLSESSWQEDESLGNAPAGGGTTTAIVMSVGTGKGSIKYRNTAENQYLEETDLFGKAFLIKDELSRKEWVLTDETKEIGGYTAQKAIYERTVERSNMSFGSFDDGEEEENTSEIKTYTDTIKVEAWFTSEIPVSHGPDAYWGLPGLILELNDGSRTFLCTKVVLNPEEAIEIKRPKKGKKVSRDEYTEIVKEKMEEMSQKYSGGSGTRVIRIGGGE